MKTLFGVLATVTGEAQNDFRERERERDVALYILPNISFSKKNRVYVDHTLLITFLATLWNIMS